MQSNTRICFDVSLKSTKLQIVKLKYVVLTTCQFGIEIAVHNLLCVNELYIIYNKHEENKKKSPQILLCPPPIVISRARISPIRVG